MASNGKLRPSLADMGRRIQTAQRLRRSMDQDGSSKSNAIFHAVSVTEERQDAVQEQAWLKSLKVVINPSYLHSHRSINDAASALYFSRSRSWNSCDC